MTKQVAFTFGRLNPPTIGHSALINKTIEAANGGDYYIFTSQTKDNDKNPLDYGSKISFLRLLFPNHASHIIQDATIKNVLNAADYLEARGYTDATFVCGSDRMEEFGKLLNRWNQIHNGMGKGFKSLNIVSSGEREDGAEGLAGVSASLARQYAKQNNFEAFKGIVPNDIKLAKEIFIALRKELGINESYIQLKNHIRKLIKELVTDDDIKKSEKEYSTRKQKTDTLRLKKSQEEFSALKDKLDAAQSPDEESLVKKQMTDKSDEIKKWKADVAADKSRNV